MHILRVAEAVIAADSATACGLSRRLLVQIAKYELFVSVSSVPFISLVYRRIACTIRAHTTNYDFDSIIIIIIIIIIIDINDNSNNNICYAKEYNTKHRNHTAHKYYK